MKTIRLFRRLIATACLALAFGSIASSLGAQEKPRVTPTGEPVPAGPAVTAYALEVANGVLIVNGAPIREGGKPEATLGNAVNALREMHPDANIAMAPELVQVRIADLKLRAAELDNEIEVLRVACGNKFVWTKNSVAPVDPATGMPVPQPQSKSPLYVMELNREFFPQKEKRSVEAFNLGGLFQQLGSQDRAEIEESLGQIKEMIVSTLRRLNEDFAVDADFQFHSGANVLVVIGSPEAIEVARKVINALPGQPAPTAYGLSIRPASNIPARISKERQQIANKLVSIRLDSVLYDGLPLSEVVRYLIDETRKRDPEKKGINFLINPNMPDVSNPPMIDPTTGLPLTNAAPPQVAVDIASISIKIDPALTNVRLVDVLDAIVRVADHPIKYSITDYAVVFSLAGKEWPMGGEPVPGMPAAPKNRFF